ncbi:MFS transporter [Streptomyces sp. NPDC014894]|uniref:MFS transporter n=1 Tax=Streptomyces sp. NPDC014894 TaxID=3364931 RepID=UPI0036F88937
MAEAPCPGRETAGAATRSGSPRGARAAVGALFFANGAAFSTWAARVPAVTENLGLSAGELAVALIGLSVGALLGLPVAGGLVAQRGSRPVLAGGVAVYLLALPLIGFAPGLIGLTAVLTVFACGNAAVDVAMNAQGVLVERATGRAVLGRLHAMFSLGGIAGALVGGVAAAADIGVRPHFAVAAVALAAVFALAGTRLLPDDPGRERSRLRLALPSAGLWAPGAVVFCALMSEGVMNDWGALYLRDAVGSSAGTAAFGFALFSAGMVVGRLSGDTVHERFGTVRLLQLSGLLGAAGALLTTAAPGPPAALAGFALLGLGLAAVVPAVFRHAAGLDQGRPGPSIAAVSTLGYTGFLAGPPVIGVIAELTGLRAAMLVLLLLLTVLTITAHRLRAPDS